MPHASIATMQGACFVKKRSISPRRNCRRSTICSEPLTP
jgi:hypothetical protein